MFKSPSEGSGIVYESSQKKHGVIGKRTMICYLEIPNS